MCTHTRHTTHTHTDVHTPVPRIAMDHVLTANISPYGVIVYPALSLSCSAPVVPSSARDTNWMSAQEGRKGG